MYLRIVSSQLHSVTFYNFAFSPKQLIKIYFLLLMVWMREAGTRTVTGARAVETHSLRCIHTGVLIDSILHDNH